MAVTREQTRFDAMADGLTPVRAVGARASHIPVPRRGHSARARPARPSIMLRLGRSAPAGRAGYAKAMHFHVYGRYTDGYPLRIAPGRV